MKWFVTMTRGTRARLLTTLAAGAVALTAMPATAAAACGSGPGSCTQAEVNASIAHGIAFLDTQQNPDGSWGTSDPGAETALALASYGVFDGNNFANLSAAQKTRVQNGLKYLLGTQLPDGSFNADGFKTYDSGLALTALSLSTNVPTTPPSPTVATAISNGRTYLIGSQNVTGHGGLSCQSTGTNGSGLGGQDYCGGWDYTGPDPRSDESNTGFALTGLDVTGGVPPAVAAANVGWQRNVQQLTSNPGGFMAGNDGGGAYQPGTNTGDFSSNANDTGSLLFGFGYDHTPSFDGAVQAAIKFGTDVLDTYEKNKTPTPRTMVYHPGTGTPRNEDGSCVIGATGCDWAFGSGEGGYHYSMFALQKGFSQYTAANVADPTNFYAKVVDLLLGEQSTDGSWPFDSRDDGSQLGATGFAILALGRVGAPPQPEQTITAAPAAVRAKEGHSFTSPVATFHDPDTSAPASEYTASINWGDGRTSSGTIAASGGGNFTVSGTHRYGEEGSFTIKVTIADTDNASNSATVSTPARVKDAALHAKGVKHTSKKLKFRGLLARFSDGDPGGRKSDYSARINWGDGNTTSGKIGKKGKKGKKFTVSGGHKYAQPGTYKVKITIRDKGGAVAKVKTKLKIVKPPSVSLCPELDPDPGCAADDRAMF